MGVCRGRMSEGLDFSDDAARAVLIVGIPNASFTDTKIVLKRKFLDDKHKDERFPPEMRHLTGPSWYN